MNTYNPFTLASKTILVTGASSGIGQATAIECARLGAKLVITGRNAERLQTTFDRLEGTGHRQVIADLTSADEREKLVEASPALNGVVLCAGLNRKLPFKYCTPEKIGEIFGTNFSAPVALLSSLFKSRRIAEAASVVFVSSVAALRGGAAAYNTLYAASKAALGAAMRHLVQEYSSRKIRFNAVNPGMVNTPLVRDFQGLLTPEEIAADRATYPLGRYGEPQDVAHGIVYLLSEAASWVTGAELVIDGGLTC